MTFRWEFDHVAQVLRSPAGFTVTVKEIAVSLQDRVHGRADLSGPWAGWKVRNGRLIAPGGLSVTPRELRSMLASLVE